MKENEAGEKLAGAVLKIVDSDGNEVAKWTTDGNAYELNGTLSVGNTYKLVEVSAPSGYELAADIEFTVANESVSAGENKVVTITMVDKASEVTTEDTTEVTTEDTTEITTEDTTEANNGRHRRYDGRHWGYNGRHWRYNGRHRGYHGRYHRSNYNGTDTKNAFRYTTDRRPGADYADCNSVYNKCSRNRCCNSSKKKKIINRIVRINQDNL